ncbi:hypothetical protein ACH5RR_028873 [Cinchona calisaya]|uniref:Uncharacterized protein n=1 Tax=Cinchona calisaya TaxID=153742 RepID=A0ABD2YQ17_9GENT
MASSIASVAARRAANLTRLASLPSGSASQAASLIRRRGLASSAADHHGPAKVNCWQEPMNPAQWKEEHFVIVSLAGWGLIFTAGYKVFTGGKKNKEGNLVEALH